MIGFAKEARWTSKACLSSGNRFTDRPINRVLSVGPAPRLPIYFRRDTVVCDANRSVGTSSKCRGSSFPNRKLPYVALLSRPIMKIVSNKYNVSNPAKIVHPTDTSVITLVTNSFPRKPMRNRSRLERYTQRQRRLRI